MKCPVCQENLQIAVRSGIEIDYCPTCRGVWLDRGELDKIIERHIQETQALTRSTPPAYAPEPPEPRPKPYTRHDYDEYHEEYYRHKRRKKRDWLEDLFDIFD